MYHIVICDDEPIFLTQISEMISDILASMGESCEIRKYTSISELKNTLQNTPKSCDILILDIMLGENNGISFAVSVTPETKFPLSSFPAVRNLYSMHILLNL